MNRFEVLGKVSTKPALKYTQGGTPVLEVDVSDTTKKGETYVTQHFIVKLYGKLAEDFSEHLAEGTEVWASGEYERRQWRGRDGTSHTAEELNAAYFRITRRPHEIKQPIPEDQL